MNKTSFKTLKKQLEESNWTYNPFIPIEKISKAEISIEKKYRIYLYENHFVFNNYSLFSEDSPYIFKYDEYEDFDNLKKKIIKNEGEWIIFNEEIGKVKYNIHWTVWDGRRYEQLQSLDVVENLFFMSDVLRTILQISRSEYSRNTDYITRDYVNWIEYMKEGLEFNIHHMLIPDFDINSFEDYFDELFI
jgi:hypothetical protein